MDAAGGLRHPLYRNTTVLNNIISTIRPTFRPTTSVRDSPLISRSLMPSCAPAPGHRQPTRCGPESKPKQAQRQNDLHIAELTGSLRELDAPS